MSALFGDHRDLDNDGEIADLILSAARRLAGLTYRTKLTHNAPDLWRIATELGDLVEKVEREP
jgi:hypothetical protein